VHSSGVVDQQIDASEARDGVGDETRHHVVVGDVTDDAQVIARNVRSSTRSGVQDVVDEVDENQTEAGLVEDRGESTTEAAAGSGDQSDRRRVQSPMSLATMLFMTSVVPP
jgi:hypothetical protein